MKLSLQSGTLLASALLSSGIEGAGWKRVPLPDLKGGTPDAPTFPIAVSGDSMNPQSKGLRPPMIFRVALIAGVLWPWDSDAIGAGFGKLPAAAGGNITSLAAVGSKEFATGNDGIHCRSGSTAPWTKVFGGPGQGAVVGFHPLGDTLLAEVWEGIPSAYRLKISFDGGASWKDHPLPPSEHPPERWAVASFGKHGLYLTAYKETGLQQTRDFGASWRKVGTEIVSSTAEWEGRLVLAIEGGGLKRLDPVTGEVDAFAGSLPAEYTRLSSGSSVLLAYVFNRGVYRYRVESNGWSAIPLSIPPECRWMPVHYRGGAITMGFDCGMGEIQFLESSDQGRNWRRAARFSFGVSDLMISGSEYLVAAMGIGIGRTSGNGRVFPDNAGLREGYPDAVVPIGNRIFAAMSGSDWSLRSEGAGQDWEWEEVAPQTLQGDLVRVGTGLYRIGSSSLGRLSATGRGFDSLPFPPDTRVQSMVEGKGRLYAQTYWPGVHGGQISYSLFSSAVDPVRWERVNHPEPEFPKFSFKSWQADGDMLVILLWNKSVVSRNGGRTWDTLSLPFPKPNAVMHTGGKWILSSDAGIFSASDPGGPWVPLSTLAPDTLLGAAGTRLLAKATNTRYRYSGDLGATWSDIVFPFDATKITRISISEDWLCATLRILPAGTEHHCSELATLPVPVRGGALAREAKGSPLRFQGTWIVVRPPSAPGLSPGASDFLGRARPQSALRR